MEKIVTIAIAITLVIIVLKIFKSILKTVLTIIVITAVISIVCFLGKGFLEGYKKDVAKVNSSYLAIYKEC